jgi:hypothetical protein
MTIVYNTPDIDRNCTAKMDLRFSVDQMEDVDAIGWNDAVGRVPEARIQQSYQGAEVRRETEGISSYFLTAKSEGATVGSLCLFHGFIHPDLVPWGRSILRTRFMRRLMGVYRWLGGPLIYDKENYGEILTGLLERVDLLARQDRVVAVQGVTAPFYEKGIDTALVEQIYSENGYEQKDEATIVLDLDADIDTLWSHMHKEARQKVRKAEKQGIEIREADTVEQWYQYYEIRVENTRRSGVRPPHIDIIIGTEPIYGPHDMGKVFLAYCEGRVVAGQMVVVFNGNVQLAGICLSDYAREKNLAANDLLQWRIIEWARIQGYRLVDWSGYTIEPKDRKQEGINRFKAKWGGRVLAYNTFSKVLDQNKYQSLAWCKERAKSLGFK